MACVPESRLQQYVDGSLPPKAAAEVEQHLDACEACRELVAETARATFPEEGPEGQAAGEARAGPAGVGRYQLVRPIGAGGLGVVYEARDPRLDRRVALKVWRGGRTAEARALLLQEARAMARLSHPNVIAVHDVAEIDGQVCVAMELIEGPTLRGWLAQAQRGWREIAQAFLQAARGLAAAHAAGLVHRDFKPDNALVSSDGRVRVTDFGLALPQTAPGSASGSPAYVAPEQLRGAPVDPRADVFSLCKALQEALGGREIPASLARALRAGLAREPEQRTPAMAALCVSLEAALDQRRRRALLGAGAGLAALLLALGGVALWQRAAIRGLEAKKAALDERIRVTLDEMQAEPRPERLRELEERLSRDTIEAERAVQALGSARAAGARPSDPLDARLRALLARFGATTYVVPPLFRARVAAHLAAFAASDSLPAARVRMARYLPLARQELLRRGLPEELVWIAFVESRFDPEARSPSGSVGLWQLMPASARKYGLVVDGDRDDRLDPAKSTRAAAAYLADLFADFGRDAFLLAIGSYNLGEGGMRAALHQLAQEPGGLTREGRDFWTLYRRKLIGEETREYVPAVIAAALLFEPPELPAAR